MAWTKIWLKGAKVIFNSKSSKKPSFAEYNGKVGTVLFRSWACTDMSEPAYAVEFKTDKKESGTETILAFSSALSESK